MSEDNEREECFYPELLLKDFYRSCSNTSTTFKFQDTGPHTITCHLTQLTSDMQSCRFPDIQNIRFADVHVGCSIIMQM